MNFRCVCCDSPLVKPIQPELCAEVFDKERKIFFLNSKIGFFNIESNFRSPVYISNYLTILQVQFTFFILFFIFLLFYYFFN